MAITPTQIAQIPVAVETRAGSAVTTEATGKHFKAMQLIGCILILFGMFSCVASGGGSAGLMVVLFVSGAGLAIIGSVGAWWHHG